MDSPSTHRTSSVEEERQREGQDGWVVCILEHCVDFLEVVRVDGPDYFLGEADPPHLSYSLD